MSPSGKWEMEILLYYLELANISIVILSDDLMSLENYY